MERSNVSWNLGGELGCVVRGRQLSVPRFKPVEDFLITSERILISLSLCCRISRSFLYSSSFNGSWLFWSLISEEAMLVPWIFLSFNNFWKMKQELSVHTSTPNVFVSLILLAFTNALHTSGVCVLLWLPDLHCMPLLERVFLPLLPVFFLSCFFIPLPLTLSLLP